MSSNPTNLISNLSKALEGGAKQYIEKRTKIHPAVSWPYDPILGLAGRRLVWPCEDDDGDDDGGGDGGDDDDDDGDDDEDDEEDDDHPLVQGQDGLVSRLDPAHLHKVPRLLKTLKEKLSASPYSL